MALEGLLEDVTAGDPITGLKWTHRSLDRLRVCEKIARSHHMNDRK